MASRTALLVAVKGFDWKLVREMLRDTPELTAFRDERGRNLLHLCCGVNPKARRLGPRDGIRTAALLLDAGLDVEREAFSEGSWKATPLWYAIARGENLPLARYLLDRGASPEHCLWAAGYRDDLAAIALLVRAGATVDALAEDETPFLAAVKVSHFRSAERLLRLGANPDFRDSRGMTALHYMLKKGSDERHLRMILAHRASIDLPDRDGITVRQLLLRKRSPGLRRIAGAR